MNSTWIGSETEYALVFIPDACDNNAQIPDKSLLFDCLLKSIKSQFIIADGPHSANYLPSYFVENGGCFYFERDQKKFVNGLCEFASPECRFPLQHLRYKKSQQLMLTRALPKANRSLNEQGFRGEFKIIKNSRDYSGNVYGEQENYQIEAQPGINYFVYCLLAIVSFPVVFLVYVVFNLLAWILISPLVIPHVLKRARSKQANISEEVLQSQIDLALQPYLNLSIRVQDIAYLPLFFPLAIAVERAFIRPYRSLLTAHLVSRIIYSGCGTIENGQFRLSEKPLVIDRVIRRYPTLNARPIFDTQNFFKSYIRSIFLVDYISVREVFKRRQRLQINLSDSNMCDVSDYLKEASTFLLITMEKSGVAWATPQLNDPLAALQAINTDPTLRTKVETNLGPLSALQIQHLYLEAAKRFVHSNKVISAEFQDIVQLWEKILTGLNSEPSQLFGQIDWITKKLLIDSSNYSMSSESARKIDLKYHQLEDGYFERLRQKGNILSLVTPGEIESAISQAPDTRAELRSKLIRESISNPGRTTVYWQQVKLHQKGKLKARVIDLDDYRH